MDAIGNVFGSLWKGISGMGQSTTPTWQKALGLGSAGFGTIGNILGGAQQNRALGQQLDLQKQMANLTPQQMATQIQQLERPLSNGLTAGVSNSVQAQLAERGLATSPGIFGETLSQALAPFYLQQQQLATQAWMQKLGIPAEYAGRFLPGAKGTDTSALWKMLLNKNQDPLNGLVGSNNKMSAPFPNYSAPWPGQAPDVPGNFSDLANLGYGGSLENDPSASYQYQGEGGL